MLAEGRARLRQAWHRFFQTCDALICPVFPTTAFPHDVSGEGLAAQLHRRRQIDEADIVYIEQLAWPGLATAANLPATVVQLPRSPGQLPLGVQIVGPSFEDRTPLRLAQLMESDLHCRAAPPPMLLAAES